MALARGILAFLPVGWLTKYLAKEVLETLVSDRVQVVNGLSMAEFQQLAADPALGFPADFPLWLRYLALTTWQGELSDYAPLFMPTTALRLRALKLGDAGAFFHFSGMDYDETETTELDEALLSGDPTIQATVLTFSRSRQIKDPTSIPKTRGLLRVLREEAVSRGFGDPQQYQGSSREADNMVGAMQAASLDEILKAKNSYFTAVDWLRSQARKSPEGKTGVPQKTLERAFRDSRREDTTHLNILLASLGSTDFVDPWDAITLLTVGLMYVQPAVVREVLRQRPRKYSIDAILKEAFISRDLVLRAREMLALLPTISVDPGSSYPIQLRIICGLPTGNSDRLNGNENTLALEVAHPEFWMPPGGIYRQTTTGLRLGDSAVHYDLDHILDLFGVQLGASILTWTDIAIIYSYGKLTRNLRILREVVAKLKHGWTDQLVPPSTSVGAPEHLHTVALLEIVEKFRGSLARGYTARGPGEVPAMVEFYRRYGEDTGKFPSRQAEADQRMITWEQYYATLRA